MRWVAMGVVLSGLAACATQPKPGPEPVRLGYCMVAGRLVPPDPVTGCQRRYPPLPAHETCPTPQPIFDDHDRLLPGVTPVHLVPADQGYPLYPAAYEEEYQPRRSVVTASCVVTASGHTCGCHIISNPVRAFDKLSFLYWLYSLKLQPAMRDGVPIASDHAWQAIFYFGPSNR